MIDLTQHNTLGLPSQADTYVRAKDRLQLQAWLQRHQGYPLLVLGGGSNVVLPDYWPGVVIAPAMQGVQCLETRSEQVLIEVGAGEVWKDLVLYTLKQGWYGLENLADIPGWVGAAPIQNIGAYGVELSSVLHSVVAVSRKDSHEQVFSREQCRLGYRESIFKQEEAERWVIVAVRMLLRRQPLLHLDYGEIRQELLRQQVEHPDAWAVSQAVIALRRRKLPDPAVLGNAGSFFKNPWVDAMKASELRDHFSGLVAYPQAGGYKLAAGWLIDYVGLRGQGDQHVGCHVDQALVLVNRGGAKAADILAWARHVQARVQDVFGIMLEIEPRVYR